MRFRLTEPFGWFAPSPSDRAGPAAPRAATDNPTSTKRRRAHPQFYGYDPAPASSVLRMQSCWTSSDRRNSYHLAVDRNGRAHSSQAEEVKGEPLAVLPPIRRRGAELCPIRLRRPPHTMIEGDGTDTAAILQNRCTGILGDMATLRSNSIRRSTHRSCSRNM